MGNALLNIKFMSHRGESASTMLTSNYGMHRRYTCSKVVLVGLFDSILGFLSS